MIIDSSAKFKLILRNGPYAWPGGYPIYFANEDGRVYCFACTKKAAKYTLRHFVKGWVGLKFWSDINWENPDLYCIACDTKIEAAYELDDLTGENND